jgi:hypothetical protein
MEEGIWNFCLNCCCCFGFRNIEKEKNEKLKEKEILLTYYNNYEK